MENNKLSLQDIDANLQKLNFEEKSLYLSKKCPEGTSMFPGQTIGQYLFYQISTVSDKWQKPNLSASELKNNYNACRDSLLCSIVGKDYFDKYMQQLEELRDKRRGEIMKNTAHLYHFSQIPPQEFGSFLSPHTQQAGNALAERINEKLCYAANDKESHYVIKPPSNKKEKWNGVSMYMDEKLVMISGYQPKEFLDRSALSYCYEVDMTTFKPNVCLDGRFTNEYESSQKAKITHVDGPFSIIDMVSPREQGGWDIPVYFIPNKDDKQTISQKINELRGLGITRKDATKSIAEQFPEKMIYFNENEELLSYAKNLEIEKQKELERQNYQDLQQSQNAENVAQRHQDDIKKFNDLKIKAHFTKSGNQKAMQKYADKKQQNTGQPLTDEDIKKIKLKAICSKSI